MNETKNEAEQVNTEKNNNAADPSKKEAETSPERKEEPNTKTDDLEERERKLAEREKALEISERKLKAKEIIKDKALPVELLDFVDYANEETMIQSIDKLAEIISKAASNSNIQKIDTGMNHGSSFATSPDDFVKGLKSNNYRR